MLSALTILLGVIPNIGIIQIGPVSFTILHIPVIIASIIYGIKGGMIIGLVFGITSWFVAITRAFTPLDLMFVNPLISILPRVMFGMVSGVICQIIKAQNISFIKCSVVGLVSTFIHSLFVYSCLYFFGKEELSLIINGSIKNLLVFLASIISINALVEAIVAAILTYLIVQAIDKVRKQ